MYEVGVVRGFRALHVMPGDPGPEGTLHAHDYRLEVIVRSAQLDESGMVVDLDLLEDVLADILEPIEGKDLEAIRGDESAVTVEVLARWVHGQLKRGLGPDRPLGLSVRVWESGAAFGGFMDQETSSP